MYQIQWGDLTPERFLNEFWQKKPLLIRQAFPDLQPVLEADELAGLALEQEVESRLIRFDPLKGTFDLQKGPFTEASFAELPESNWTLLVQAVDHYIDGANELLDCFTFIPRWRIDDLMISYATPDGGVGPHYDNYDVFLLQASGSRRWEVGALESSQSNRIPDLPLMILSDFEPLESYDLEPGDMLYLPPQVAHNGVATSADCMTYSIGFRAPSEAELLRSFSDAIGEKLSSESRYTDPDLKLADNPGEIDAAALARVKDKLSRLLDNPEQLAHWFGTYISEAKYAEDLYQPDEQEAQEWLQEIDLDEGVSILPGSRLLYMQQGNGLQLFCNGIELDTQKCDTDWIINLCNQRASGPIAKQSANQALLVRLFTLGGIE